MFDCHAEKKFSLQFLPRYFYNYFVLVNVYLMQNIKKKPIEIWVSLFFHKIDQICPKDHT